MMRKPVLQLFWSVGLLKGVMEAKVGKICACNVSGDRAVRFLHS